jgi:WD40 repeat protein
VAQQQHVHRWSRASNSVRAASALALLSIAASPALARVDLLAASGGGTNIVRFNETTGAPIGNFTNAVSLPRLIAFGPDGNLYVADYGGGSSILRFDGTTGASMGVFATGGLSAPTGLAFGPNGDLFACGCSGADIIRYSGSTGAYIGVFGTTPNTSGCMVGMRFGPTGDLLVAEQNTSTIERYNGTTGVHMGAFAQGNGIYQPEGITIHNGDLYIANYGNNDVLRFNGTTGAFVSVFVPPGSGGLIGPYDLAFGPDGNLYVGSYGNSNVLEYDGTTGAFIQVFASGGGLSNTAGIAFTGSAAPHTYCTAGTTSHGCVAMIGSTGAPSASAATPFSLSVANVEGQKQGIIFYGINNSGFSPLPWATGSSAFLCVKPPSQRTLVQSSGGTINQCNGQFALDWNAYIAAHPGALGSPFAAGQHVYAQAWFRDPPSPKTTMLSDAIEYTIGP